MKLAVTGAACIGLALSTGSVPLFAQLQDNSEKTMTCNNGGNNGDRARHCEVREQTVASIGSLNLDGGSNGGVTVKGWLRGDTLVRTRVEAQAESEGAAASLASQVWLDTSGGQVHAQGPQTTNDSSWSVSYEIFAPQNTNLSLKTRNGAMTISDVRGQIHFDVANGAVHLKRVAGDVSGNTVNGAIQMDLVGSIWDGRQVEVTTGNGAITLAMPSRYSAHIQAETMNGGIQSDFPMTVSGNIRPRQLDFNLNSGGPLIHLTAGNGQIRLKRSDTQ